MSHRSIRRDQDRRPTADQRTPNALVQARRTGQLSRRQLLRRAAAFGISAPVLGVILHATGDHRARLPRPIAARAQPAAPATPSIAAAATPTSPQGTRQEGGALVIASPAEPDTLHPWLTRHPVSLDIIPGLMEGLLRFDHEQRLQPALAESFAISDDGLSYTFTLRPDVTFQNGDAFGAVDVVAAWETKQRPNFAANSLGWNLVAEIETPDEQTVVISTNEPYGPLLSSVGVTPLCPTAATEGSNQEFIEAFGRAPVGTGPFQLSVWESGERIVLERYDGYRGPQPGLDTVTIEFVADPAARLDGLRDGSYQLLGGASALTAVQLNQALPLPDLTVREYPTKTWQHLDLKQIGFLRETPVRQALDFATPKQRIIDEILGGRAVAAFADQAPGSWAYHPDLTPRPYALDQAAALLDEVGLTIGDDGVRVRDGEPFTMELWGIEGDALAQPMVELIAAAWNGIGVATTIRYQDAATIWQPMGYQFSDKMTACLYAWTNANDPDDLFYWHSSQIPSSPTASGGNLPAFFYPYKFQRAIDALIEGGLGETDLERRREIYHQLQELLYREVPVIFLYWDLAAAVTTPTLGGFSPHAASGLLANAEAWYLADPTAATPIPRGTPIADGTPVPESGTSD